MVQSRFDDSINILLLREVLGTNVFQWEREAS